MGFQTGLRRSADHAVQWLFGPAAGYRIVSVLGLAFLAIALWTVAGMTAHDCYYVSPYGDADPGCGGAAPTVLGIIIPIAIALHLLAALIFATLLVDASNSRSRKRREQKIVQWQTTLQAMFGNGRLNVATVDKVTKVLERQIQGAHGATLNRSGRTLVAWIPCVVLLTGLEWLLVFLTLGPELGTSPILLGPARYAFGMSMTWVAVALAFLVVSDLVGVALRRAGLALMLTAWQDAESQYLDALRMANAKDKSP